MSRSEDTPFAVNRRPDGIVVVRWRASVKVTGDLAIQVLQGIDGVAGGHPVRLLVDIQLTQGLDRESRSLFQQAANIKATALLVDSPVSRVVANLFIGLNRPAYPIRLFTAEAEALTWLRGFAS